MIDMAKDLLAERFMREKFVGVEFADGCSWAMLLDLYRYQPQQISAICYGSGHPYTTALRHLRTLTDVGLIERSDHASDGRSVLCTLSEGARDTMTDYLTAVSERRKLAA